MLPTHYNTPPLWKYVHDVLSPIKWLWWRIVETMFRVQFGLEGDLLPKSRIELDLFGGGQIHDYNFRDMLKRKELQAIKGSISSFDEHGVTLEDGTRLDADIVVYGTGFGKSYEYFDQMQNRLNIDSDGNPIYTNPNPNPNPNPLALVLAPRPLPLPQHLAHRPAQRRLCGGRGEHLQQHPHAGMYMSTSVKGGMEVLVRRLGF